MSAVKARTFLLLLVTTGSIAACDGQRSANAPLGQASANPAAPPVVADSASPIELGTDMTRRASLLAPKPASLPELESSEATAGAPSAAQSLPAQEVVPGSMLVRVGQASLQVDSLEIGIARVRDMARHTGAIIANTSMEGGRERTRSASLELRVPSERFEEAVNGLGSLGKLETVNVTVQDVGEEFVDVQARLANARRLEQRLIELLANRTGKLADVLRVERELARVREEIERYEGRIRYLRARASVSTLTVTVHEPYPIVAGHPGAQPIRDAFVQAWRNFVGFTAGFIALLGVLLPLGAVLGVLVLVGRRMLTSRGFRLTEPKTAGTSGA